MRKLQEQIADLASVIKAVRQNSHLETQDGDEEHEVHRGLMDCVDKMRLQQQEERKSMIALFQRHCQVVMCRRVKSATRIFSRSRRGVLD